MTSERSSSIWVFDVSVMCFLDWKNKRIRYALKVAIKKRDKHLLPPAVKDFKQSKLPDDDLDLEKAEKILREFLAKDGNC